MEKVNGYLTKKMFYWIIGIFVGLTVSVLGYQIGKIDKLGESFNHNFTTVRNEVSEIKVDIAELRTGQEFILEYIRKD